MINIAMILSITPAEKLLVCVLAGVGAGIGVGLTGMSAAVVISPMLITFLNVPAYEAVGIALAADVPAAAVSAVTYYRNKNIELRTGLCMMASVLLFTLIGSAAASFVHNETLGDISVVWTFILGVWFLLGPKAAHGPRIVIREERRLAVSIACGALTGFVCGFVGAGGGLMLLFILSTILGYDMKHAVGTSVFIMTFSALLGAASHFIIGSIYDWAALTVCAGVTLLTAYIASKLANKADSQRLKRDVGILLVTLGTLMLMIDFLFK